MDRYMRGFQLGQSILAERRQGKMEDWRRQMEEKQYGLSERRLGLEQEELGLRGQDLLRKLSEPDYVGSKWEYAQRFPEQYRGLEKFLTDEAIRKAQAAAKVEKPSAAEQEATRKLQWQRLGTKIKEKGQHMLSPSEWERWRLLSAEFEPEIITTEEGGQFVRKPRGTTYVRPKGISEEEAFGEKILRTLKGEETAKGERPEDEFIRQARGREIKDWNLLRQEHPEWDPEYIKKQLGLK